MASFVRALGLLCAVTCLPLVALAAQPAVRVAVFSDPAYVDEASATPAAEGPNVRAALTSLGFAVTPFTGVTAALWRTASDAADVVDIPENEIANLSAALPADAKLVLRDFVAAGGVLVIHGDLNNFALAMLNSTFGFATAAGNVAGQPSDVVDLGSGTRFLKGPATLTYNSFVAGVSGLPVNARVLYRSNPGLVASAAYIPVGAGRVVYLGWDWYSAVPNGASDGGWNDVLRRAVLEGRPPTRRVAVFDDPGYVDSANGATAESDTVQATLVAQDDLVTTFTGIVNTDFDAALGTSRMPSVDVLVIPEQEIGALGPPLQSPAITSIRNFVGAGGTLIVHGGFSTNASTLLNTVFNFTTTDGGSVAVDSTKTTQTSGTLFVKTPDTLTYLSGCTVLGSLPPGSKSLYEAGAGLTTVAQIPFGEGRIFFIGWDWFDAAPLGAQDGGWLAVYDAAIRSAPPARRVAVWNDPAYVNSDGGTNSEQVNVRASLVSRGHSVRAFKGTTDADWSAALAKAEVVVVPDLESGDPSAVLDAATRAHIAKFVQRGGVFVTSAHYLGRGLSLTNAIFGTGFTLASAAGPYPQLATEIVGTPFATGPASIPQNNATSTIANSPANARRLYANGADAAAVWAPIGAGHVLVLGWDWFDAVPGGGSLDGGWVDVLDLAVQSTHSRTRRVAVFDDNTYVDSSSGGVGAESDNVQATLASLDHPVAPFTGATVTAFRTALGGADVLLIPEQENSPLSPALTGDTKAVIRDFVAAGGTLVTHYYFAADLINALIGGGLAPAFATGSLNLDPAGSLGTRFAGASASLPNSNATTTLAAPFPFASQSVYVDGAGTAAVSWIPYGLGRIVFLGWDWFDAVPIGGQDSGWVDVLDRAVQDSRPRTRTVAVFDDPAFEDTANSTSAESDMLQAAVVADGHVSAPFVGVTADALSAGLAKSQALYVPELQTPLLASLTPAAQQVLRDYVARGGSLAVSLDSGGRSLAVLNSVYALNLSIQASTSAPYSLTPAAANTRFAGGPAQLIALSATLAVTGFPANATAIYDHGGTQATVVQIPYGAGEITVLGWDFFGQPPYFAADAGQAAWREVLARALDGANPAARRIALYADPTVVDASGSYGAEATNLELLTLQLDHVVAPFTGTSQVAFSEALALADVLLIPEQEVSDLAPQLSAPTLAVIRQFVNGGGGLLVNGTDVFGPRSANILNAVLNVSVGELFTSGALPAVLTPPTVGTQFAGGPASLTEFSATSGITGLPAGSLSLYVSPTDPKTFVAEIPRGYGRAIYLGWDFFDAAPNGSVNDAAWNDVLDRAIRENVGGDADSDGVSAATDLCPITFDPGQGDTDSDGVGNACDNCTNIANARVTNGDSVFLAANGWATLTGAQRDDDHDGYGNKCDAKFVGTGLVGSGDIAQYRASNNKSRVGDTCGTSGLLPCAIFDLDEVNTLTGSGDIAVLRTLTNKLPGPRCATCPLPCSAGPSGTCN